MKVFRFKDIKDLDPCYTDYKLKKLIGRGITMQGILSSDVSRQAAELYPQPEINYYQIRQAAYDAYAATYAADAAAAARLAQDTFLIEAAERLG